MYFSIYIYNKNGLESPFFYERILVYYYTYLFILFPYANLPLSDDDCGLGGGYVSESASSSQLG